MNASFDGILIINKEKGYTSNDVVQVLRGILHMKKIGHTGTLDPAAEGVLPVCLGKGTKLVSLLTDKDKEYRAVARLGVTTDTEDMTGNIISEKETAPDEQPSEQEVRSALNSFIGDYDQVPPMYSAKKVDGKKLYELAREGKVIERKPCPVKIFDIKLIRYEFPLIEFSVHCGKGTYVRSLIRDLGEKLGCGAAMESLVRTGVSGFTLKDAVTLKEAEDLMAAGKMDSVIKDVESVFSGLPSLRADSRTERFLKNGNVFRVPSGLKNGDYRVHTSDGAFAAIYTVNKGEARPKRMFL